jgi:pimeloyl-ACP methyl ester carboxylesterase
LVLISSGGLGHEVSPLLRSATLPGVSALLSLTLRFRLLEALEGVGGRLRRRQARAGIYFQAVARALRPLENAGAREAFLQTLRAVIDMWGQRVSATDRLYLLESMPTMIVWGERDNTIPLRHGHYAHEAIPHSQFRTLPYAAHFPHLEDPVGLAEILREFVQGTEPGRIDDADWGAVLARRSPRSRRVGDAAA